jgi:hypothetical protein
VLDAAAVFEFNDRSCDTGAEFAGFDPTRFDGELSLHADNNTETNRKTASNDLPPKRLALLILFVLSKRKLQACGLPKPLLREERTADRKLASLEEQFFNYRFFERSP